MHHIFSLIRNYFGSLQMASKVNASIQVFWRLNDINFLTFADDAQGYSRLKGLQYL